MIAERMREHISELLGPDDRKLDIDCIRKAMQRGRPQVPDESMADDITWQEVAKALKKYQNHKAQGPGDYRNNQMDICIEILKYAIIPKEEEGTDQDFRVVLARWFTKIIRTGTVDPDMAYIRCTMIPKVMGARKMDKFRGISVMNTLRRLFSLIIVDRLDTYLERRQLYRPTQFGFRKAKSIIEPCQILQHLQWISKTRQEQIYVTFLDITKAYDKVNWTILWEILEYYGIPLELIRIIKQMFEASTMAIQYRHTLGKWFKLGQGVPQGDPKSPTLFSLYAGFLTGEYTDMLETDERTQRTHESPQLPSTGIELYYVPHKVLIPQAEITTTQETVKIWNPRSKTWDEDMLPCGQPRLRTKRTRQEPQVIPTQGNDQTHKEARVYRLTEILYADDTMSVSSTLEGAMRRTNNLLRAITVGGLTLNKDKCTWMKLGTETKGEVERRQDKEIYLIDGQPIKRTYKTRYLGSQFTAIYNKGKENIDQRLAIARNTLDNELEKTMINHKISWRTKLRFYRTDIVPILMHGVQFWTLSEVIIKKLETFQRNALLRILNRTYRDRIASVDIYEWLKQRKSTLYPMELIIKERKLRHYSRVVRSGLAREELASILYWSDIKKACGPHDFEYEHVKDLRVILHDFRITEEEANVGFVETKTWEKVLKHSQWEAYDRWKDQELKKKHERNRKRRENGDDIKELEEEKRKNGGWWYKRRPLPP